MKQCDGNIGKYRQDTFGLGLQPSVVGHELDGGRSAVRDRLHKYSKSKAMANDQNNAAL